MCVVCGVRVVCVVWCMCVVCVRGVPVWYVLSVWCLVSDVFVCGVWCVCVVCVLSVYGLWYVWCLLCV